MAYTKNTWKTGDIVSSQKLNHMEDGIANSENVFIVGGVMLDDDGEINSGTLDKTWQEIHDAMQSKIAVAVVTDGDNVFQWMIDSVFYNSENAKYVVKIGSKYFVTYAKNGHPTLDVS